MSLSCILYNTIFDGEDIDEFSAKLAIHQNFPFQYIVSSSIANTGGLRKMLSVNTKYWYTKSVYLCVGMASSTPKMQISPHPPPDIGKQLECFVSYAHTPNEFYIQLVCNPTLSYCFI